MIKKLLIGLLIAGVGLSVYAWSRPSEMFISREVVLSATPEEIFPYINNSVKSNEWMPWQESDPGVKMSYSGPAEGVGSKSSWDSSGQMGTGEALVVTSVPNQVVKTQLTYTKPMHMSQLAEVSLTPVDGGTRVRWSVTGQNNFLCRLMGVFMDMDKLVGGQFEKGLSNLKAKVEVK